MGTQYLFIVEFIILFGLFPQIILGMPECCNEDINEKKGDGGDEKQWAYIS